MSARDEIKLLVKRLRDDSALMRDKANELEEYATRLKVYGEMMSDEAAEEVYEEIRKTMPHLFLN